MQLAEQLRAIGLPTFPCWVRHNPARGRWDKGPAVPKGESWQLTALRPLGDPLLNWSSGVVGLPVPAGVVILDLDVYKGATRQAVETYLGCPLEWDRALVQRTISGGEHYAFRCAWPVRQGDSLGLPGFDTRAAGKGFICTGQGYTPVGFGPFALAYPDTLPALPEAARSVLEKHAPPPPPAHALTETTTDVDQVIAALRFIDPGCPRAEWVRVGLALRHYFTDEEGDGEALFHRWSAGEFWPAGAPPNYVPEHIPTQWGSFKPEGATTIATLFYRAIQAGWRPPISFNTAAAFGPGAASATVFDQLVDRTRACGGDTKQTPTILEEIRSAGCNALQIALLAAELKNALKDAGVRDAAVGKLIDSLLTTRVVLNHPGSTPKPGSCLDDNTPLHPSMWAPMQTKGKDLKPKGTLRNFEIMLDAYGVSIEFNEIKKQLRIAGPTVPRRGVLHEEAALAYLDSLANLNEYPTASVRSMIMPIANKNVVNPVRNWVLSAPWDGRDHVGMLWSQIRLEDGEDPRFCEVLFRKWMRGAYAIGTGLLDRWEFAIVLIDPDGGAGKTRFFASLCPRELRTDGVILDPSDRDNVKIAISYWLTELGELDGTFSRADIKHLMAFLSLERDEMRLAYGRAYLEYPRRTAFFASVNQSRFLVDQSGNRRFWGMRVVSTNHLHQVDTQQAWAQVAAELARGEIAHLTPEEDQILRQRNETFRVGSEVSDKLSSLQLAPGKPEEHFTVTEILAKAGMGHPSKGELNEAASWLRRMGHRETKRHGRAGFTVTIQPVTAGAFKPALMGAA